MATQEQKDKKVATAEKKLASKEAALAKAQTALQAAQEKVNALTPAVNRARQMVTYRMAEPVDGVEDAAQADDNDEAEPVEEAGNPMFTPAVQEAFV